MYGPDSGKYNSGYFSEDLVVGRIRRWYSNGSEENYCYTLNTAGEFVMEPRADISWGDIAYAHNEFDVCYNSGLCPAQALQNGLWGYLDTVGNWVIDPIYSEASNFSGGFAVVKQVYPKDEQHFRNWSREHLIDNTGRIVFSTVDN